MVRAFIVASDGKFLAAAAYAVANAMMGAAPHLPLWMLITSRL